MIELPLQPGDILTDKYGNEWQVGNSVVMARDVEPLFTGPGQMPLGHRMSKVYIGVDLRKVQKEAVEVEEANVVGGVVGDACLVCSPGCSSGKPGE